MTPDVLSALQLALNAKISLIGRFGPESEIHDIWMLESETLGSIIFDPVSHNAALLRGTDVTAEALELAREQPAFVEDPYQYPFVRTIEYYATSACNMGCKYCYLGELPAKTSQEDRSAAGAVETVRDLFDCGRIGPEVELLLIGGEPLLAQGGVSAVVSTLQALCAQHGVALSIRLTTNGSLINQGVIDWLRSNSISLTLSLDGHYQQENRPLKQNSRFWRSPRDIIDLTRNLDPSVRATLLPEQHENQSEIFRFMHSLGAKRIAISGAYGRGATFDHLVSMVRGISSLEETCTYLGSLEANLQASYDALTEGKLARSHCAAGSAHIVLNSSGDVRPCANYDMAHDEVEYDVDQDSVCGKCAFRYVCSAVGGGCRAWRGLNRSSQPDPLECISSATRFILGLRKLARNAPSGLGPQPDQRVVGSS